MDARDVTAVVLTRDEERNLPRVLTSLPRAMPVLVLDACSCDRTAEFARDAGAQVIERAWTDFVDARHFALAQVRTPWTLMIDADEALDDVLCAAILTAPENVNGYALARTTYFAGKPMRLWRNERLVRLVRTAAVRVEPHPAAGGDAALHERLVCDGATGVLPGTLLHFSYPSASAYRAKFRRYTTLEAQGVQRDPLRALTASVCALVRFASNLLRRGAVLDGPRGWFVAWYSAWYPAVVAWKALWS